MKKSVQSKRLHRFLCYDRKLLSYKKTFREGLYCGGQWGKNSHNRKYSVGKGKIRETEQDVVYFVQIGRKNMEDIGK